MRGGQKWEIKNFGNKVGRFRSSIFKKRRESTEMWKILTSEIVNIGFAYKQ